MSPHLDLTEPYAPLVRRIETEATITADGNLRIDHFLNHRVEPGYIAELGHELARRLSYFQPNVILTAEASGIAPALIVAQVLSIPMVYAKKYSCDVESPAISRVVASPGRGAEVRLALSSRYVRPGHRVVVVDDFLSNGRTAAALVEMAREAGAEVLGAGFIVEKRFNRGREYIAAMNVPIATLAQVEFVNEGRVCMTQPPAV